MSADTIVPGQTATAGPPNPQDLNRYSYVTNNPLNHADPTGHCGTSGFRATAVSVMSGDCTRRAYDALTKAKTTEGQVVSGAVMVASAVGAAAGWVGGAILAAAGVSAAVGAVAGGGTAAVAAETGGAVAAAASADGDPTNEVNAAATVAQSAGQPVFAAGKWLAHFQKHMDEFSFKNADEYLQGAQKLTSGGEGILTFTRKGGDTLFYNPTTNEFAALAKGGEIIRTYFKPEQGLEYWRRITGDQ